MNRSNLPGMSMFRSQQRVSVIRSEVPGVQYRDGTVVEINADGSAIVDLDGSGDPKRAEVWPEDCVPC